MDKKIRDLEKLLAQYTGGKKKLISSNVTNLTSPGENYMSVVVKVDAVLKDEETGKEEKLSAVGKCIHSGDVHESIKRYAKISYKYEKIWYTIIVPTLENFLEENDFKRNFDIFPTLIAYRANLHGEDEEADDDSVLLMENLATEGYANIDRHVGFDYEGAKMILKDLATFHAVPLAMKLKQPVIFEEKIKKNLTKSDFKSSEHQERESPDIGYDIWLELLETRDICKSYLKGLKAIFDFAKENPDAIWEKPDTREPFATITHNDLWVNNTMQVFREDKIFKNKFVDFQLYSYGSPADDLIFFIWTSVQLPVIKEHFNDLLKYYHSNFLGVLVDLGCDTSDFSYEKFEIELKISNKLELVHSLLISEFIFAEKGKSAVDMTKDFDSIPINKENLSDDLIGRVAYILKISGEMGWI